MLIRTNIKYNHRRVYRLIGQDLFSVAINKPLESQEYMLEKSNVIKDTETQHGWQIVIQNGKVCLEF